MEDAGATGEIGATGGFQGSGFEAGRVDASEGGILEENGRSKVAYRGGSSKP